MNRRIEIIKGALILAGILFIITNFPIIIIFIILFLLIRALKN